MRTAKDQLPDDVETLKRLLLEREAQAQAVRQELYAERLLVEKLKLQIARLRRMQFGRRSERHDEQVRQLELLVEELEVSLAPIEERAPAAPVEKDRPARKLLPEHLPRTIEEHAPACGCPHCGSALRRIGEDVAEHLEYIPEHFKVVRVVRPKMGCPKCLAVIQEPAPSRPIPKAIAGAELLAHVAVSKYLDHLPLYRQSEIYARQGVDLERSTMADWIGAIARLVEPLADLVGSHVMAANKVHADDTTVPVLDPGRGKTKTGRLWVYVRDDRPAGSADPPAAWYRYTPTREGAHPKAHLRDFRGTLQADGYSGFDALYATGKVREAACWAHVRRKFYELHAAKHSPLAEQALARIKALYDVETLIRGKSPQERRRVRQEQVVPLLAAMKTWLEATLLQVSAKSELSGAINYALKRWAALVRYCDEGNLEIDNNAAERALRAPALSRKNFLFAGADSGGERAAMLYTLLETAKLNGLNPEAYLRHVLERIAEQPSNRLAELLPWSYAREQAKGDERLAA